MLAVCPLLVGCGSEASQGTPNTSDYRLGGRLLGPDGQEVSRETFYLHFFCDDAQLQKTLNPASGSSYEVLMPQARVRVRAVDKERVYKVFEKTLDLASKSETFDIRLQPTNYILLRGRVEGYEPPASDGAVGDAILLYFVHEGTPIAGPMAPERDGTYALRVPRGKITIRAVNTAGTLKNPTVDLTGNTAASHDHDIEFE